MESRSLSITLVLMATALISGCAMKDANRRPEWRPLPFDRVPSEVTVRLDQESFSRYLDYQERMRLEESKDSKRGGNVILASGVGLAALTAYLVFDSPSFPDSLPKGFWSSAASSGALIAYGIYSRRVSNNSRSCAGMISELGEAFRRKWSGDLPSTYEAWMRYRSDQEKITNAEVCR